MTRKELSSKLNDLFRLLSEVQGSIPPNNPRINAAFDQLALLALDFKLPIVPSPPEG